MTNLITSEDQLRSCIPNAIPAARGEVSLFDKLSPFILSAQSWVASTFTGDVTFEAVASFSDIDPLSEIRDMLRRIVVCEAFRMAAPSLDVVLSPNGFGIVNSSNLAPASSQRVERFVASMVAERDRYLFSFLRRLHRFPQWLESEQCRYFAATLFPIPDVVNAVCKPDDPKWEAYADVRARIQNIELDLETKYFSAELMAHFRSEVVSHGLSDKECVVVNRIKLLIVARLKGLPIREGEFVELVNFIRSNPEDFELWHSSPLAKLYEPPVFVNQKNSSGYFF